MNRYCHGRFLFSGCAESSTRKNLLSLTGLNLKVADGWCLEHFISQCGRSESVEDRIERRDSTPVFDGSLAGHV